MNGHLGSLARFTQVAGVHQMEHMLVEMAWNTEHDYLHLAVQYDSGVIRFSPCADENGINTIHHCVQLTSNEFLSVLVWLIRRGLLEDVGLVSTETVNADAVGATLSPAPHASPVPVETHSCRCTLEPSPIGDNEPEMNWAEYFAKGEEAETEGEPTAPFALPIFELKEGAGDPEWLNEHNMMIYLHHELELSATDISRLCDTTPARVRGALKRLGIEFRSYRGGRSKLAPRREERTTPASTDR